jgi:hypothetical protein
MVMRLVRYGIPAVLVVAGFVVLFTVDDNTKWEGWAGLVGAGLSVLLLNWLFRIGAAGDRERDDEQAARDYLAAPGHWPDEKPRRPGA